MPIGTKKSLLITTDWPPHYGGVAVYYHSICSHLPGNKVVVIAPVNPGVESFDWRENFTVIRKNLTSQNTVGGIGKIFATFKWLTAGKFIRQIVKNHQIELLQVGQVLPLGTVAMMNKIRTGLPYIFYAHGLDILAPQKTARKKQLLKKIIHHAAGIVANSHFTKDELVKLGADPNKIAVVHPCPDITPDDVNHDLVAELQTKYELKNKKIILTVGRLVKRKGHDLVITALPEIIKQIPDVLYVIVGAGPDRRRLENLVSTKQLGEYVKFIGQADRRIVASFYELCELFIMPSRELASGDAEGFGIAYLEAASFGKPAIGGKSGGVGEAIVDNQTGLLVDPESSTEIAQATLKLLNNKALAHRLGLQGLARVTETFDWKTQAEKVKNLLK